MSRSRHVAVSIAILLAAFSYLSRAMAGGDDRLLLETIRQDWRKRREQTGIVRYELIGKTLLSKGFLNYEDTERKRDVPPSDVILEKKATWLIDFKGNRIRREVDEQQLGLDQSIYRSFVRDTFDGTKIMHSVPRDKNPPSDDHEIDVAITTASYEDVFFVLADYPLFIAHGNIPTLLLRPNIRLLNFDPTPDDFFVHSRASYNGARCVVLRTKSSSEGLIECWVDESKEYAVVKWMWIYSHHVPFFGVELDYQHTPIGWLPKSWTSTLYRYDTPDTEERAMVKTSETLKVEKFEFDPTVGDREFEIIPSPGQNFSDAPNKKTYRVQPDGALKEFDPSFPPVAENKNYWLRVLLIVGACVFLVYLSWKVFRRQKIVS